MLTLLNRLPKYFVVILGCLAISFSYAQEFRADDTSIFDIDGSGEVDALTDGLLLLRSMCGFSPSGALWSRVGWRGWVVSK